MFLSLRIAVCLLLIGSCVWGQNLPTYSSYFANPYLYNPAAVATEHTTVFLHHRQQWLGFEGAPVISTLSINSLINNSHVGLGFKASSFQRGPLTTTDATVAYAYEIPVAKKGHFFFGMSAGAITNKLDLTSLDDPDDPALASYQANNIQTAASAGILFQSASGLNLGITLPQLFAPAFLDANFEEITPSPFDNIIASVGYRKKWDDKLVSKKMKGMKTRVKGQDIYAPLELYLMYRYATYSESQAEVMAKFNFTQSVWAGATYRLNYGIIANAGFNINKFSLGYSYELASQPDPGFSQATHEVFLSLRTGEKKKFKRPNPVLRSTLITAKTPQHHARFQHQTDDPEKELTETEEVVKKRYYVVVRSFADFTAADEYKKKLLTEKYNADVFYYAKDKKYHVYTFNTTKQSEANDEVKSLKSLTKLKSAFVLTVEEKTEKK